MSRIWSMIIKLIQEICCDLCNDGIHVHMEKCPCCQMNYAGTSIYGNIWEAWGKKEIPEFTCEECKTLFVAPKPYGEIEDIYEMEWIKK
jgi:hypothetical protein